jgi:hypothetical protein
MHRIALASSSARALRFTPASMQEQSTAQSAQHPADKSHSQIIPINLLPANNDLLASGSCRGRIDLRGLMRGKVYS